MPALALVIRELDLTTLRISRARCPLCCADRFFIRISLDLLGTRCLSCAATPISMAIGTVLAQRVRNFADLRVCELSSAGPFHAFLSRALAAGSGTLTCSEYLDGVTPGSFVNGVQCQDVQQLSYPDGSFDVCTSTEVFEHVPDDRLGFSEVYRVLAPGGRLLMTVPLSEETTTIERALLEDGTIRHLLPATYHDDKIRGPEKVLVYRDYGIDITERLRAVGFTNAEVVTVPDPTGRSAVARVVTAER